MLEALLTEYRYPNKNVGTSVADMILLPMRSTCGQWTVHYDPANQSFKEDQKTRILFFRIVMLPVSVILSPVALIACIIKVLDSELRKINALYQNRFIPQITGEIELREQTTGYLGNDNTFHFSERIKLPNGKNLIVSPKDFYCRIGITSAQFDSSRDMEFPSSLFSQAKEGNKLRFYLDDVPWELNIKVGFEKVLKNISKKVLLNDGQFLYDQDIPENYRPWFSRGCQIVLSPAAKKITIGKEGIDSLNYEGLTILRGEPELAAASLLKSDKGELTFILEVPGYSSEDIDLILDNNVFYMYAKRTWPSSKSKTSQMEINKLPSHIYFLYNLNKLKMELSQLDFERTSTYRENGRLFIRFPTKKSLIQV